MPYMYGFSVTHDPHQALDRRCPFCAGQPDFRRTRAGHDGGGMRPKARARGCTLAGLGAAVALGAPASSHPVSTPDGSPSVPATAIPVCAPEAASGRPPTTPAGFDDPRACRIAAARVPESSSGPNRPESSGPNRPENAPESGPTSGYRHLGAGTADAWAGVSGQLTVSDPVVRTGTYDFVATRFMAKRELAGGEVAWLEAGWAETGWSGKGRQRIYTYDTNRRAWRFYDEFVLRPGDRVWLDLHADADGVWQAWLWWDDRWNLLSAEHLPIGPAAHIEQYVEVHVDADRPARVTVPPVAVDGVRLRPADGGRSRPWRDDIATLGGLSGATGPDGRERGGGFCLDWITRYDTWTAGDCDTRPAGQPPSVAPSVTPSPGRTVPAPDGPAPVPPAANDPAADRPRGDQPDGQRPADEEPATVIDEPAPAAGNQEGPSLPLLGPGLWKAPTGR
jgi:hypothetical protein